MRGLHVLALLAVCSIGALSETVMDKGDHYLVCKQAFDLGIIFDVSMSIGEGDFGTVKQSLVEFLKQFSIGPTQVRVGLIPFENEIHTDRGFTLNRYSTSAQVVSHVTNLPHVGIEMNRQRGARTETWKALEYVRTTLLSPSVTRSGIPRVCLVMTDGNSQNWAATKAKAQALRDDGVTVYAVGFGTDITMEELINIAGDTARVKLEKDFAHMVSSMMSLAGALCRTFPKAAEQQCPERDVYFVFSRVELGASLSAKAVGLLKSMSNMRRFRTGYRWGVASGVCPLDAGFGLTSDVSYRLNHYYNGHLTAIINNMLKSHVYYYGSHNDYGSHNEPKCNVAVLVVNEMGLDNLQGNVDTLRRSGAGDVIIWNLSHRDVRVHHATVVSRRASAAQIARTLDTEN